MTMTEMEGSRAAASKTSMLAQLTTGHLRAAKAPRGRGDSDSDVDMDAAATDAHRRRSTEEETHTKEEEEEALLLTPFLPLLARLQHAASRATTHDRKKTSTLSATASLTKKLRGYADVNELMAYSAVVAALSPSDLDDATETEAKMQMERTVPEYRRFESGSYRERCQLVLRAVRRACNESDEDDAHGHERQPEQGEQRHLLRDNELFRNSIYTRDISAILVNALASPRLAAVVSWHGVMRFALAVPTGVELVEALVLNDPSRFQEVVKALLLHLRQRHDNHHQQQQQETAVATATASALVTSSLILPFALRHARNVGLSLAALSPLYATELVRALRDEANETQSVAAVWLAFQLVLDTPVLRRDVCFYATFLHEWMATASRQERNQSGHNKTDKTAAATATASATATAAATKGGTSPESVDGAVASVLTVYLTRTLRGEDGGDTPQTPDKSASDSALALAWGFTASLEEEARFQMSQFRELLLTDLTQFQWTRTTSTVSASSSSTATTTTTGTRVGSVVAMLHVVIHLLVLGRWQPDDHETTQLLRFFDRIAKEIGTSIASASVVSPSATAPRSHERMISLMYVAVLLLCVPHAVSLAKIPSQRDEMTKLTLTLAQQCIYSLYNAKSACPLLVLSSVLLYTKSPSLLPFWSALLAQRVPLQMPFLRIELLFSVGDSVLKPILTENVMAREVLITFQPVQHLGVAQGDVMEEMTLRSIHSLLTERSFLRHHHAKKLHDWLTDQVLRAHEAPIASTFKTAARRSVVAELPVHPLMVSILLEWIENYVMAFEYPITQRPLLQLAIHPLRDSVVMRTLRHPALNHAYNRGDASAWATAVLVLTYALQFNQRMRQASAVSGSKLNAFVYSEGTDSTASGAATTATANNNNGGNGTNSLGPLRGTSDIVLAYDLSSLPLANVYREVMQRAGMTQVFEFIAPTLQRLMTEEMPQYVVAGAPMVQAMQGITARASLVEPKGDHGNSFIVLQSGDVHHNGNQLPSVSWSAVSMWLQSLASIASSEKLQLAADAMVQSVVPVAILHFESNITKVTVRDTVDPVADATTVDVDTCFEAFGALYLDRIVREHRHLADLQMQLVQALCVPHLVWKQYQQQQQQQQQSMIHSQQQQQPHHQSTRAGFQTVSGWISREQLIAQPFYLIEHAHPSVFRAPSLLRVLLSLVNGFRDLALFTERRRRDLSSSLLIKPTGSTGSSGDDASGNGSVATSATAAAATEQFRLVQDCLLVHAVLKRVKAARRIAQEGENELVTQLCGVLHERFCDEARATTASTRNSTASVVPRSPPLLLIAVHMQGYAEALVPVLVTNVPAMRSMWMHWMGQRTSVTTGGGNSGSTFSGNRPSSSVSGGSGGTSSSAANGIGTGSSSSVAGSSSSRGSVSGGKSSTGVSTTNGSSSSSSKSVVEFVVDCGTTEKDWPQWRFRVLLFFALCERYYLTEQSGVVVPTIKHILNKLRGIGVSAIGTGATSRGHSTTTTPTGKSSSSSLNGGGTATVTATATATTRVALVDALLRAAVTGCGPHADLRTEVAQFLVNLKKHIGSATDHGALALPDQRRRQTPAGTSEDRELAQAAHCELESSVAQAYQRVLLYA